MGAIWVVGEPGTDGRLAKLSTEVASLARELGASAGRTVTGIVVAAEPAAAAAELAEYVPRVLSITDPRAGDHTWSTIAAAVIAGLLESGETEAPELILTGASADGRDLAGFVSALRGLGVLTNATSVAWGEAGVVVEMSAFGGKLQTTSGFTGGGGIVTVRPSVVTAAPAASAGTVETREPVSDEPLRPVKVVERVSEAGPAAAIEEARIIVSGGRGVGGPDGFHLVGELAGVLGGAVGASRAAVDSGWISYSQQIGQTGKIVRPELYLALGISGAIQHKVGMQAAGTIVAVNRDPDAPIAEFADLLVVGDLFEVGGALLERLRARTSAPPS
jgi:electron transfer flavoprotein alpha subunit